MTVQHLMPGVTFTTPCVFAQGFTITEDAVFEVGSGSSPTAALSSSSALVVWNQLVIPDAANFPLRIGASYPEGSAASFIEITATQIKALGTNTDASINILTKNAGNFVLRGGDLTNDPVTGTRNIVIQTSNVNGSSSTTVKGTNNIAIAAASVNIPATADRCMIIGGIGANSISGTVLGGVIIGGSGAAITNGADRSVVIGGGAAHASGQVVLGEGNTAGDGSFIPGAVVVVGPSRGDVNADACSLIKTVGGTSDFGSGAILKGANNLEIDFSNAPNGVYRCWARMVGRPGTAATAAKVTSTVDTGTVTPSTSTFAGQSALSASDSFYNGWRVKFTSGALSGEVKEVSGYTGATRAFTFSGTGNTWSTSPSNTDAFTLINPAAVEYARTDEQAFTVAVQDGVAVLIGSAPTWTVTGQGHGSTTFSLFWTNNKLGILVSSTPISTWLWSGRIEIVQG